MSASNPALARVAKLKKEGKTPAAVASKKSASKTKVSTATTRNSEIPWQKIKDLYEGGKTTAEISDTLKLTRPKTKDGSENKYPYYLVVGYLTKLSHGVEVNGKTLKIKRGK